MKLLFDQNLSSGLVDQLSDVFPESEHVKRISMSEAEDLMIWNYARDHGFTIVSKDSDFQQRSLIHGSPPKIIWLRVGNCRTSQIETLLREHSVVLHTFDNDPDQSLLILS